LGLAPLRDATIGARLPIVPIRCVFVDDNPTFLEAARVALEREGISVAAVAATSAEALRQVEAAHPDVVLVDIFLGDESGLDLARQLTDDGRTVIVISTYTGDDVARLVAEIPASFLSKAELTGEAIRRILQAPYPLNAQRESR
jgi:CheY-like chemotaxis protein